MEKISGVLHAPYREAAGAGDERYLAGRYVLALYRATVLRDGRYRGQHLTLSSLQLAQKIWYRGMTSFVEWQ